MVVAGRLYRVIALSGLFMLSSVAAAQCPQYRETAQAPEDIYWQSNPLEASRANLKAGQKLWRGKRGGTDCVKCHGKKGEGNGPLAKSFAPPPRNLACAPLMAEIPDGQLFWVIRQGSENTAMPAHPELSDEQVWQLVMAVRALAE